MTKRLRQAAVVVALLSLAITISQSASAALLAGNQIEIGWTGSTPFGTIVHNGAGDAVGTFTVPMGSGFFTTSPYASSTDMRTSVNDTNISITNNSFGFVPPQWFEYVDVNNTLPDFRTLTIAVNSAATTDTAFNPATEMQVNENAIALEFAEVPNGKTISIDVTPEPATLSLLAAGVIAPLITRRRHRR